MVGAFLHPGADLREIPLRNGGCAIVDDADFDWLKAHVWYRDRDGYAWAHVRQPNGKRRRAAMHRLLVATTDSHPLVDHINANRLDNQRHNLRACTISESSRNRARFRTSAHRFRGIDRRPDGKYRARIGVDGQTIRTNWLDTDVDAARAYDALAARHHGEFARLNFEGSA